VIFVLGFQALICQEMYMSKLLSERGRHLGRRQHNADIQGEDQLALLLYNE